MNKENNMTSRNIALEIARQLGNPTLSLLGARDLLHYDAAHLEEGFLGGLRFRVGRNPGKVTHILIALHASDTYTLTFSSFNKKTFESTTLSTAHGVFAEDVRAIIEDETGLLTSF